MTSIETTLQRWTRRSNQRRAAELILVVLAFVTAGMLMVAAFLRQPDATLRLSIVAAFALGGATWLLIRAARRYRQGRTDVTTLARELDALHESHGVITTALAVERGRAAGDASLRAAVVQQATVLLQQTADPSPPLRIAGLPWTVPGALAVMVALLSHPAPKAHAGGGLGTPAAAASEPELSHSTLERLRKRADALGQIARHPGVSADAQKELARARTELEALQRDRSGTLAALSRADRSLASLASQLREERLFDRDALASLELDALSAALQAAARNGDNAAGAALAEALAKRLEEASNAEVRDAAAALANARDEAAAASGDAMGGTNEGSTSADGATRANTQRALDEVGRRLTAGDSGLARAGLRELAERLRDTPHLGSESVERQLEAVQEAIREARREAVANRNGETGGASEGATNEPGSQGATDNPSPGTSRDGGSAQAGSAGPSGGQGPGGGDEGRRERADDSARAAGSHEPERIETSGEGPPAGAVRAIMRFANGEHDLRDYESVHREYEAAAEAAIRRESVPLSRRDYIRRYFESVRGQ